jgi:hypothetical protein
VTVAALLVQEVQAEVIAPFALPLSAQYPADSGACVESISEKFARLSAGASMAEVVPESMAYRVEQSGAGCSPVNRIAMELCFVEQQSRTKQMLKHWVGGGALPSNRWMKLTAKSVMSFAGAKATPLLSAAYPSC